MGRQRKNSLTCSGTRGTPDLPGHEKEPFAAAWLDELQESGASLAAFPMPAR